MSIFNTLEENVHAVVVMHEPDIEALHDCLNSLVKQCAQVFVVDNGSSNIADINLCIHDSMRLVRLNDNFGIGLAQNLGIQLALKDGAEYILLSDQDTAYPLNYVADMVACLEKLKNNCKIAAVCPNFFDVNRSELCPMIVDVGPFGNKLKTATSGLYKVCFANASGMLIPADAFSGIGLMRGDLFIDCVDTEWCLRANKLGYAIYCNCDVQITHSLGDKAVSVLGRTITQRSPIRHYYMTRNSFYLALHSQHLFLNQRFYFIILALKRVFAHSLLSALRLEILQNGLIGMWHGIICKLGKHE